MPCLESSDMEYVLQIITFLEMYPEKYNTNKMYSEGHSQNSMFSAYIAFCNHEKFSGVWQSGSGMALTGIRVVQFSKIPF